LGETVQELSYNLQDQPVMQKDPFGNRTAYSYGLDGKIQDVRRFGDGKWNGGAGDSSERGEVVVRRCLLTNLKFSLVSYRQSGLVQRHLRCFRIRISE
jgi:YD repeat-containing protein